MILRCYNCGLQGHKTQNCPSYGPKYPAPGKSSQDYRDEAQRILELFASDILAEHAVDENDHVNNHNWLRGSKISSQEIAAREHQCVTCGAQIRQPCRTKSGGKCGAHKSRYSKIDPEKVLGGNGSNHQRYADGPTASTDPAGETAQVQ